MSGAVQAEVGLAAAGYADQRHAPGTSGGRLKSAAGAGVSTCRSRSGPPADRQVGEHDGEAGIDRVASQWQTGRARRPGLDARKLFPMLRRSRQPPMTKPRHEPKAAAFGVTTGERAATASRPWTSVKQPTVRADRHRARIPSAMRPWTPRHAGLQRDKMTHHGTEKKRPASARIRSRRAVFAGGGRCWVRTNVG